MSDLPPEATIPADLGEDAKPIDMTLAQRIRAAENAKAKETVKPDAVTQDGARMEVPKRGPGRPKGSTNRPKTEPEPATVSQQIRIAADKRKKVEEYEEKVAKELNDQLFSLLIGYMGVPTGALYRSGMAPAAAVVNPAYTELGNRLAIPPMLTHFAASLVVDLEYSDRGKTVMGAATGGTLGMVVKAAIVVILGVQYAGNVQKTLGQMKAIAEQFQAAAAAAQAQGGQ